MRAAACATTRPKSIWLASAAFNRLMPRDQLERLVEGCPKGWVWTLGGKAVGQPNRSAQKLEAKRRLAKKLAEVRRALISAGFNTTSKQAAVLGLSRATAWFVLNRDNKVGPSADVVKRILSSAKISSRVRRKFEEYIQDKGLGLYGHDRRYSRRFREQFPEHFSPDHGNGPAPVDVLSEKPHAGNGSGVDYFNAFAHVRDGCVQGGEGWPVFRRWQFTSGRRVGQAQAEDAAAAFLRTWKHQQAT